MRNVLVTDLLVLGSTVPVVVALFRWIDDRSIAATLAGLVFLGGPVIMALVKRRQSWGGVADLVWWLALSQFVVFFAIPIFGLRLINWGVPFDGMTIFGVPGPQWHGFANRSFSLMALVMIASDLWRNFVVKK